MPYHSADGPLPSVTADEMRELDRIAVEETGPTLLQMLEHAGRSLAGVVLQRLSADGRVVVLAGRGHNGAGGIAAARHLHNRGIRATVVPADADQPAPATQRQLEQYLLAEGSVAGPDDLAGLGADLVVDAVVGYGLRGAPRGVAFDLVRWAADRAADVVALDVPTGVDATSGRTPGAHVVPDVTLTIGLPRTGLRPGTCGDVLLADVGLPTAALRRLGVHVRGPVHGRGFVTELTWYDEG